MTSAESSLRLLSELSATLVRTFSAPRRWEKVARTLERLFEAEIAILVSQVQTEDGASLCTRCPGTTCAIDSAGVKAWSPTAGMAQACRGFWAEEGPTLLSSSGSLGPVLQSLAQAAGAAATCTQFGMVSTGPGGRLLLGWKSPREATGAHVRALAPVGVLLEHARTPASGVYPRRPGTHIGSSEVIENVVHDLKSLLSVIAVGLQQIKEAPRDANAFMLLEDATERAQRLVLGALASSPAQGLVASKSGARSGALACSDLCETLRSLHPLLQHLLGSVELEMELEPISSPLALAPTQLEQVIMNLVLNARDASSPGQRVVVRASEQGSMAALSVSDQGEGIPEELHDRIFERHFSTKEGGHGIGLAAVHQVVEQAHGRVLLRTDPGQGTTFEVHLPCSATVPATPVPLVMVVEDDVGVRHIVRRMLTSAGYQVLTAPDAEEGLALFGQHRSELHLVLTDVRMPGIDGDVFAQKVRDMAPDLPILLMSGHASRQVLKEVLPPVGWLAKPFDKRRLLDEIRAVSGQAQKTG